VNASFPEFIRRRGPLWLHIHLNIQIFETKLDGFLAIAVIDSAGKAWLWSRNRLSLEPKFPTVRDAVEELNLRSTILDGEIVALDEGGILASSCFKNGKSARLLRSCMFRLICLGITGVT
jgi:bifunctional non-homologous end joining protein LigD